MGISFTGLGLRLAAGACRAGQSLPKPDNLTCFVAFQGIAIYFEKQSLPSSFGIHACLKPSSSLETVAAISAFVRAPIRLNFA